jgi:putative Mg2+ transporter-C (MgtC) family protein
MDRSEWFIGDAALLLRLGLVALLCGAIGWDREKARRAAGLRTHMLVGVATALFMLLGHDLVRSYSAHPELAGTGVSMGFDPMNLVRAVISGISFLGAGTIFVAHDDRPRGLTTAASLLATASVAVAVALDRFTLAVGATVLFLVILGVLQRLEPIAHTGPPKDA